MFFWDEQGFKDHLRRVAEKRGYRKIACDTLGAVSYSKVWRIANIDCVVDINDYFLLCNATGINPMGYISNV